MMEKENRNFESGTNDSLTGVPCDLTIADYVTDRVVDLSRYYADAQNRTCAGDAGITASLLSYTLSHCNLEALEQQLKHIEDEILQKLQHYSQENPLATLQNNNQLLSALISGNLQKVQDTRSQLQSSIMLVRGRSANPKKLKKCLQSKANIEKSVSTLLVLKQLRANLEDVQNQREIEEQRDKLKTSGLVLVPSLIEKSLLRLAWRDVMDYGIQFKVGTFRNLRAIVENFMVFGAVEQGLNYLVKMYVRLKKYIKYAPSQIKSSQYNFIDEYCQQLIHSYIREQPHSISSVELIKTKSVAQCNPQALLFFYNLIEQFQQQTYEFVECFLQSLESTASDDSQQQQEYVSAILQYFQDRQFLFSEEEMRDIKDCVILNILRKMYEPLIKINQQIVSEQNKQEGKQGKGKIGHKNEKHYLKVRSMVLYENIYDQILIKRANISKIKILNHKTLSSSGMSSKKQKMKLLCSKMNSVLGVRKAKKTKEYKNKGKASPAEFAAAHHENYARIVYYLTSKMEGNENSRQQLQALWSQLIAEPIFQHIRAERQPANILHQIYFQSEHLCDIISSKCAIERQIDMLDSSIKQKQSHQQLSEKVYQKLLSLNFKTFQYCKFIRIATAINMDKQVIQMHENAYLSMKSVHGAK